MKSTFLAGHRQQGLLKLHESDSSIHARHSAIPARPSLYDQALRLLAGHGFRLPSEIIDRDLAGPHRSHTEVTALWRRIYESPDGHWPLYELAEKLADFEDYFRRWRFNHVTTVERIIGMKRGTGGTEGVAYLRRSFPSFGRCGPNCDSATGPSTKEIPRHATAVRHASAVRRLQ